jgi:hypothetical protein
LSTNKRIVIGVIILALLTVGVLAIESSRRGGSLYRLIREGSERFSGECIPIYAGKDLRSKFCHENAARLIQKRFIDKTDKKRQEGWLLRDVLLLSVKKEDMKPETRVRVSSSSRGKKAELAWQDINNEANLIILAPTKQGTLKLASVMKGLDLRTQWVQEVDRIEILRP